MSRGGYTIVSDTHPSSSLDTLFSTLQFGDEIKIETCDPDDSYIVFVGIVVPLDARDSSGLFYESERCDAKEINLPAYDRIATLGCRIRERHIRHFDFSEVPSQYLVLNDEYPFYLTWVELSCIRDTQAPACEQVLNIARETGFETNTKRVFLHFCPPNRVIEYKETDIQLYHDGFLRRRAYGEQLYAATTKWIQEIHLALRACTPFPFSLFSVVVAYVPWPW